VKLFGIPCSQCSHGTGGWTVVDLSEAVGISTEWTHDEGEIDAQQEAEKLNSAWVQGYRVTYARRARLEERHRAVVGEIRALADEYDSFGPAKDAYDEGKREAYQNVASELRSLLDRARAGRPLLVDPEVKPEILPGPNAPEPVDDDLKLEE